MLVAAGCQPILCRSSVTESATGNSATSGASRSENNAPNPYAARVILEPTPEPHSFIMRPGGAFATLPFGERFTFSTGAAGQVTGYVTSGARFFREQPRAIRSGATSAVSRGWF